jgi:hypothetical protein
MRARLIVPTAAAIALLLVAVGVLAVLRRPTAEPPTAPEPVAAALTPTAAPRPPPARPRPNVSAKAPPVANPAKAPKPPARSAGAGGGVKLLFGMGSQIEGARTTSLVRETPVKMLTSWYNGPDDLSWMARWRTSVVPQSYAAGYALHLVIWTDGPEGPLSTAFGQACGRGYPLSSRFADDMRQLAQIFRGQASGPPLYVTLFTEFQTFPCVENAWNPNTQTNNYYRALKDQFRAAYSVFHENAPNARVSLGWGGWQVRFDQPDIGGGRSMFKYFDDVMRMSDFQSFQAMHDDGNATDVKDMVARLGRYGPVMLAHYKPESGSQSTFDSDMHAILTGSYLAQAHKAGLFAISFMDNTNLSASPTSYRFVSAALRRYGGGWQ